MAQPGLSIKNIKSIPIYLPPLQEQQEIVNRIEKLFKSIEVGELVPQDPNDEPASVLLERIQAQRREKPQRQTRRLQK